MAYNDSGVLPASQSTYQLGNYTFELKVQTVHEPGEPDVVSVLAVCRGPDGARETQATDFPVGTTLKNWCVEVNETEASVYANLTGPITSIDGFPVDSSGLTGTVLTTDWHAGTTSGNGLTVTFDGKMSGGRCTVDYKGTQIHSSLYNASERYNPRSWSWRAVNNNVQLMLAYPGGTPFAVETVNPDAIGMDIGRDTGDVLVGRFAIDLCEADGGPDGDWDEPGSTGEPSYTLNVSVTGASSGSNSGIPLEAQEQSVYGSGGYGGNGGGGGAGASTVIIYEFATDKAGTVNQEATAQGPGTGGPGGKGGKGGDGCILIFY